MTHRRSWEHLALFTLTTLSSALVAGCSTPPESLATTALRLRFPDHAAAVLDTSLAYAATDRGFALPALATGTTPIARAELPRRGEDPIRIEGQKGFSIQIRELGADGEGRLAGNAVAYHRAGGTSYWTAATTGVEEWLHLDAGLATVDHAVAAWEIDGASVIQMGNAVALRDGAGVTRIVVTAPVAYAASGRAIAAHLSVHGARIELTVDAAGEAVLVDPLWTSVSSLVERRINHTMTLLASGGVLIAGGNNFNAVGSIDFAGNTAELRDPSTGVWTSVPSMLGTRVGHTATRLGDGRVLVTGGTTTGEESGAVATAEIYTPATNTWTAAPSFAVARYSHAAIAVGPGDTKVLVFGGVDVNGLATASAQLYDSVSNTWSAASPMVTPRFIPTAVRLSDGRILVAGGKTLNNFSLAVSEIYDPTTNSWSATAPMHHDRYWHSAVLLGNGKVLVSAGNTQNDPVLGAFVKISELYDPQTGTWTDKASLATERDRHGAALLPNGGVLVASGNISAAKDAELYDPALDVWVPGGALLVGNRTYFTMLRLDDGSMLVAGGVSNLDDKICELYTSGATGAPCTVNVECQSGSCVSGACAAIVSSTSSASSGAGGGGATSSGVGGGVATSSGVGGSGGGDATSTTAGAGGGASALGSKSHLSTCSVDGLPGRDASSGAPFLALGVILALRRRKSASA